MSQRVWFLSRFGHKKGIDLSWFCAIRTEIGYDFCTLALTWVCFREETNCSLLLNRKLTKSLHKYVYGNLEMVWNIAEVRNIWHHRLGHRFVISGRFDAKADKNLLLDCSQPSYFIRRWGRDRIKRALNATRSHTMENLPVNEKQPLFNTIPPRQEAAR